ncbi:hypothetical protein ACSVDE_14905 [Pseudalkalibacillus sp. Hm43]|uniref:hypothetical protein n=1 Tax=Pseudalkalibacillus sp. Hm43 TaxID=3450742 RepID=UPI003F438249
MELFITAMIIFFIILPLFFIFIYKSERKENNNVRIPMTIFVSSILSLIITITITALIVVVTGSASLVSSLFKIDISKTELIIMGVALVLSNLTVDNVIITILKYFVGDNQFYSLVGLFLYRMFLLSLICILMSISLEFTVLISTSVPSILLLFEYLVPKMIDTKGKQNL